MAIGKSLANEIYARAVKAGRAGAPSSETMARPGKRPKYGNNRTVVDGITFDSLRESRRYSELKTLEKAGLIRGLRCQPKYPLRVNGEVVAVYIADFRYLEEGRVVIEDVKSVATAKDKAYRLKNKMFHAIYKGLTIREV